MPGLRLAVWVITADRTIVMDVIVLGLDGWEPRYYAEPTEDQTRSEKCRRALVSVLEQVWLTYRAARAAFEEAEAALEAGARPAP